MSSRYRIGRFRSGKLLPQAAASARWLPALAAAATAAAANQRQGQGERKEQDEQREDQRAHRPDGVGTHGSHLGTAAIWALFNRLVVDRGRHTPGEQRHRALQHRHAQFHAADGVGQQAVERRQVGIVDDGRDAVTGEWAAIDLGGGDLGVGMVMSGPPSPPSRANSLAVGARMPQPQNFHHGRAGTGAVAASQPSISAPAGWRSGCMTQVCGA